MTVKVIGHPSVADRAKGADARIQTPPSLHTGWVPAGDRPDPVALLEEQNATRDEDLVPVWHGRMLVSPFTFYRGAARIMATDLAGTPTAGLTTQLCADAHLSNFGVYASPERDLVFDVNDFDETLPGPFEYDVKRMAASFTIAARNNGLSKAESVAATQAAVRAYREAMAQFAQMRVMERWYTHMSAADIQAAIAKVAAAGNGSVKAAKPGKKAKAGKRPKTGKAAGTVRPDSAAWAAQQAEKNLRKAYTRDSLQALSKLDHPTVITGERGARKPARPVREETDGKGPAPRAPHRRSTSLDGRELETEQLVRVTEVGQPDGEPRAPRLRDLPPNDRHRASSRPYGHALWRSPSPRRQVVGSLAGPVTCDNRQVARRLRQIIRLGFQPCHLPRSTTPL